MTVTVEIPMKLPSAGNLHEHWRHRHKRIKAQRAATRMAMSGRGALYGLGVWSRVPGGILFDGRMVVTLTRVAPRKLDDDNLAFAFKGIRDEIAAYFGVDDADPRIAWRYEQAKGPACVRIGFEVAT